MATLRNLTGQEREASLLSTRCVKYAPLCWSAAQVRRGVRAFARARACVEYVNVRPCVVVCRTGLPCSCGLRERMLPVRVWACACVCVCLYACDLCVRLCAAVCMCARVCAGCVLGGQDGAGVRRACGVYAGGDGRRGVRRACGVWSGGDERAGSTSRAWLVRGELSM